MMTFDQTLAGIVAEIYRAALEPARWADTLDRIADVVRAQHAHIFIADSGTMQPSFAAVGRRMPEDLLHEFHVHYAALDPRLEAGQRAPAGVIYPDHELCPPEEFERSEFYNDFYRRCGSRWMAGVMLERTEIATVAFAVVRTPGQKPFAGADIQQLESLQPHLTNALRVQQRLAHDAAAVALSRDALDGLAIGIVVFDDRGRVAAANRAARAIAAGNDGLAIAASGIKAASHRADAALQRALGVALRASRGEPAPAPAIVAVPRLSGRRSYEVLFAQLPPRQSDWGSHGAGVLAVLTDPTHHRESPAELLAALYGFTRTEAQIAARLATGASLAEIAAAGGYTRAAVRWHLRQVFQKTGTHRQAELVMLLNGGVLNHLRWDPGG